MSSVKSLLKAAAGVGGGISEGFGKRIDFIGSANYVYIHALVVDSDDNVYVGGSLGTNNNPIVQKLDSDLVSQWLSIETTSPEPAGCWGLAVDDSGNVYAGLTGTGGPVGDYDIYIRKYNSSGTYQANRYYGGLYEQRINSKNAMRMLSSGIDGNETLYLHHTHETGSGGSSTRVGAVVGIETSLDGHAHGRATYNGNGVEDSIAMCVTPDGGVVHIADTFYSSGVSNRVLLTKYDADFSTSTNPVIWQSSIDVGSTTNINMATTGQNAGTDADGNIYFTINFTSGLTGPNDVLIKLNSSGVLQWAKRATFSTSETYIRQMDVAADGSVYVHYYMTAYDYFSLIQRWNSDGTLAFQKIVSRNGETDRITLASDSNSDLIMVVSGDNEQPEGGVGYDIFKLPKDGSKWGDAIGPLLCHDSTFSVTDVTSSITNATSTNTSGGIINYGNLNYTEGATTAPTQMTGITLETEDHSSYTFSDIKPICALTFERTGTTSSTSMTLPDDIMQEDDLVVFAYVRANTSTPPIPSGYQSMGSATANDTDDTTIRVVVKRMGATPDSTVILSGTGGSTAAAAGVVGYVFRGATTSGDGNDVSSTTSTATNTILGTAPSITPVTSGALAVAFTAGGDTESEGVRLKSYESGSFGECFTSSNDSDDIYCVARIKEWSGSGSVSFSQVEYTGTDDTSNSTASVTVAIRPN